MAPLRNFFCDVTESLVVTRYTCVYEMTRGKP